NYSIVISFCGLKDVNITYYGCIDKSGQSVHCSEQLAPTPDNDNDNCQSHEFLFNETNLLWLDINSSDSTQDMPRDLQDEYSKTKITEIFMQGKNYISSDTLSIRLKGLKIEDQLYGSL